MTAIEYPEGQPKSPVLEPVEILGVPVHGVTIAGALETVMTFMREPGLSQIATVNPEFVMKAQDDSQFLSILQKADLCIADGVGLLFAARWKGQRLPERVAGSDLVYLLAEQAQMNHWRLFLLGAAPGVAESAGTRLQEQYQGLIIAGTHAGSPDPVEDDQIIKLINDSQADLLYVAYGAPGQDKWIARNRQQLKTVRVAMGVGGSLDFISGRTARAPQWSQRLGLEWLYRLYKEPWRWRRMLALPHFIIKVVREG